MTSALDSNIVLCRDCGRPFDRRPVVKFIAGKLDIASSPITLIYSDGQGRLHYICRGCHVPGDDELGASNIPKVRYYNPVRLDFKRNF